jgi:hypothetical protein
MECMFFAVRSLRCAQTAAVAVEDLWGVGAFIDALGPGGGVRLRAQRSGPVTVVAGDP